MTTFQTIASGSGGNAALLTAGDTRILLDMGISCRKLCAALARAGTGPAELDAVFISHEHSDHIAGLATYIKKYSTPIFTTPGTARQLAYRLAGVEELLRPVPMGETADVGACEVTLLPTSHDCRESAAFRVDTPDGAVGLLTDTGFIPERTGKGLLGVELLVLESNHDVETLRSGPYPLSLKRRVLGEFGHLSNDEAAAYAAACARAGTQRILLAHLSRENNTPRMALNAVGRMLEAAGFQGELAVAERDTPGRVFVLERVRCGG
ncbi:MAG: MBL fold metallo-hydrolase [Oscillospiraceae bacterium]|nr:MBL fold metallo-hydrolase [Oscillospiraceae bacterium]